ncbi:response regulator transcription factor [Hydrogenimonas thermophila]|uniref:response regulator transcription factor n=1 Tax=Hydrogenimonas thermophila TaxID=223786 RepID=UPI002936FF7C|nr:response regulator transcription factor [Hydrogenimonas thermophila]WOE69895.1 response regulator transcription factor [Hydrogenimonas thermophila]WOE72410.1 response regulator transcription factor [Hydrogenimonas thermophila]
MVKVLMIEDDEELAEILSEYLQRFNIETVNVPDPFLGLSKLETQPFDLVILDLSLPGMDGLDVCEEIRKRNDIPIIISSARNDLTDKIVGLEKGADDYLPKPYDPRELVARIKTILRRIGREKSEDSKNSAELRFDKNSRMIYFRGEPLHLTAAEYGILTYLLEHANEVVSREDLIYNVDAIHEDSSLKSIDVIISRIRHKLEDNPKQPRFIRSVRGLGYRLTP